MANFFSKCFSELALMATAMLWAGCGDVDKDSKNEKSVSNGPVESSDSAALPHALEKDDSLASDISKDSLDTNSQTVVLLDSVAQLEVQRTRDSLMKAFFPIEWNDTEKNKYEYQNVFIQRYLFAKNRDSILKAKLDLGSVMCYYGVIADRNRPRRLGINDGSEGRFNNGPENQMLGNTNVIKLRGLVKVLYEKIESADNLTLNQEMLFRVKRVFKQRIPGLRLIYGKFLKKNNAFQGKIVLKMAVAADGTIKESSIKKSTTGVKEFDEEIRSYVNRWTFSKVDSGTTVVYVPIHFYEDAKLSSQPK